MRELEEEITRWRRQMSAGGINALALLDELESHLCEEVEQQMKSGISVHQAFQIAVERLGQARALKHEFSKVDGMRETKQMKRIIAVIMALFGMVFGLSMVLPQLGQWSRTGVMHSVTFLSLGAALILVGGSAAVYGIRTNCEARGRTLISIVIIAAGGFYAMPFILAFFQPHEMNLMGWIFCASLTVASILFFGSCFHLNRHLPPPSVHDT